MSQHAVRRVLLSFLILAPAALGVPSLAAAGQEQVTESNLSADPDKDTEPSIAVNPRDPSNIIVTYMHNVGDQLALDNQRTELAWTRDAGRTWSKIRLPFGHQLAINTADASVRFDRFGVAYVAAVAFSDTYHTGDDWLMRSADGGQHWSVPTIMMRGTDEVPNAIDRPWIATGPRRGQVYMTSNPSFADQAGALVSRQFVRASHDGGLTWGAIRRVDSDDYPADSVPSGYLSVDPRGTLAVTYIAHAAADATRTSRVCPCVVLATSHDEGRTWSRHSAPTLGPNFGYSVPATGEPVAYRAQTAAIGEPDPTHAGRYAVLNTYIESQESYLAGTTPLRVELLLTDDDGVSWRRPAVLDEHTPSDGSSTAWPAWSSDGKLAVVWRHFDQSRASMPFTVWFTTSSDGGQTFARPAQLSTQVSADTGGLGDEYIALGLDAAGLHAAWSDARGSSPQIYLGSLPWPAVPEH